MAVGSEEKASFAARSPPAHPIDLQEMKAELLPRMKEWKNTLSLIAENRTVMLGLLMVLFILLMAIFAPVLAPPQTGGDPMQIPADNQLPKPPFKEGVPFLGTGYHGIDIYYGVIWGARTTIVTSLFVVLTAALVGLLLGSLAGYCGGRIDEAIMRFTDIFLSIPALIFAMAIAAILTKSIENMMFALILVWWPSYARLVRGQVLSVRENTYVEAARAIGCRRSRILLKHIVPNSVSPLIVSITLDLGAVALVMAGLSYIGFGVGPGYAEWGRMISDSQQLGDVVYEGVRYTPWWALVFPGMALLTFTLGCCLVGDGLRDVMDPRTKREG